MKIVRLHLSEPIGRSDRIYQQVEIEMPIVNLTMRDAIPDELARRILRMVEEGMQSPEKFIQVQLNQKP